MIKVDYVVAHEVQAGDLVLCYQHYKGLSIVAIMIQTDWGHIDW